MPKNTEETIRTSVVLTKRLWSRFKGQIWDRLGVSELSAALDILIDRWLEGASDSNQPYTQSTKGLDLVMDQKSQKPRYSNPDLAVLEEATAKAWEEQNSSDLARVVISLLRFYGSEDSKFWVDPSGKTQQPQGNGPGARIAGVPEISVTEGRPLRTHKKKIG